MRKAEVINDEVRRVLKADIDLENADRGRGRGMSSRQAAQVTPHR
jgi:hypothetical protein